MAGNLNLKVNGVSHGNQVRKTVSSKQNEILRVTVLLGKYETIVLVRNMFLQSTYPVFNRNYSYLSHVLQIHSLNKNQKGEGAAKQ